MYSPTQPSPVKMPLRAKSDVVNVLLRRQDLLIAILGAFELSCAKVRFNSTRRFAADDGKPKIGLMAELLDQTYNTVETRLRAPRKEAREMVEKLQKSKRLSKSKKTQGNKFPESEKRKSRTLKSVLLFNTDKGRPGKWANQVSA